MQHKTLDRIIKSSLSGIALIAITAGAQDCVTCPPHQTYDILGDKCIPCECTDDSDCYGSKPYCNGCFCVECINAYDSYYNTCDDDERCVGGTCLPQ